MKQIDTRGLSCPQPVIMVTKTVREDNESFEILIDNETVCENVLRTLERFNLKPKIREEANHIVYTVER